MQVLRGKSAIVAMVVVAASLVAAAAPAAAREPAAAATTTTTYVGTVKGVGSLAVIVDADHAFAYLCDSADVSDWFRGSNNDGALDLQAPSGATIAAGVKPKLLDGVLAQPDGTTTSFKLKPAKGDAGLYRAEQVIDGAGYAAGWVKQSNGKVDGNVSAANIPGGVALPARPAAVDTTVTTVAGTVPLGAIAPKAIAAVFPPDPPPADQVTVVPFNSSQQTAENAGSGSNEPNEPSGGPTTTVPVPACKDVKQLQDEISALQTSLSEAGLLKRRAIKEQITRLQAELKDAERGMNCTLPLK